jgi:hypothetical protein
MGFREDAAGSGRGSGMIWPVISAADLIGSLASFQWGMRKFFTQPSGDNAGLKLIRICGSASAPLHLAAIAATPHVAAWQALGGASLYISGLGLFWWSIRVNRNQPLSAAFSSDDLSTWCSRAPIAWCAILSTVLICWFGSRAASPRAASGSSLPRSRCCSSTRRRPGGR